MEFIGRSYEWQISIFAADMENEISFEDYLVKKKINSEQFKSEEGSLYVELEGVFNQVHPDSFTAQKLFLINPIRRKYPLTT